jgi:hypothetical protein
MSTPDGFARGLAPEHQRVAAAWQVDLREHGTAQAPGFGIRRLEPGVGPRGLGSAPLHGDHLERQAGRALGAACKLRAAGQQPQGGQHRVMLRAALVQQPLDGHHLALQLRFQAVQVEVRQQPAAGQRGQQPAGDPGGVSAEAVHHRAILARPRMGPARYENRRNPL